MTNYFKKIDVCDVFYAKSQGIYLSLEGVYWSTTHHEEWFQNLDYIITNNYKFLLWWAYLKSFGFRLMSSLLSYTWREDNRCLIDLSTLASRTSVISVICAKMKTLFNELRKLIFDDISEIYIPKNVHLIT
jgi:hypothetical protein